MKGRKELAHGSNFHPARRVVKSGTMELAVALTTLPAPKELSGARDVGN